MESMPKAEEVEAIRDASSRPEPSTINGFHNS
jgi:hypothetical protein